jgi:hypothetical protein
VIVCARGALQQTTHSLFPTYAAAGKHWLTGSSLYRWPPEEPGLDAYRYSPTVAVALVPFALLPTVIGNVLWRLLNAGVLLGGLAAWLRSPLPWRPDARQRALVYLLVLPLATTSLNNGQTNPLVIGFLLLTVAAAGAGRWNAAALCTAVATALKIYPLTMGLLLAAAFPWRFAGRLVVALAAVAVVPFFFQQPGYVTGQYAEWLRLVGDDDRRYWPLHMAYRDLWLLFRVARLPVSWTVYQVVQVLTGSACAVICVGGRLRGWPASHVLTAVLTLGTSWMILCGPATESSTYVLLAPAFALAVVMARVADWSLPLRRLTEVSALLLLAGILAGLTRSTSYVHSLGVQPLAALLLFVAYVTAFVGELVGGVKAASAADGSPAARAA